jgi:hypothetical protein
MKLNKQFVRDFLILINEIKKSLKSSILDCNEHKQTLQSPVLKYIAALREKDQLLTVAELARKNGQMKLHWLENRFIDAIYLDSDYQYNALFLVVKAEYNSLDSQKLNYGMDSLISAAMRRTIEEKDLKSLANYDFDTTVNIIYAYELGIANDYRLPMGEIIYRKMVNSQKEFVRYYQLYRTDPNQIKTYDWDHYDHLKSFALNYYAMVRVMADLYLSEGNHGGFVIHDAGSSTFQLALLLATLHESDLMNLKIKEIIASDLELVFHAEAVRYLKQSGKSKPLRFIQQDFRDETLKLPEADVTILNDVLEHFPSDALAFQVLERFWKRTRKLLIVHVPLEAEPGVEWGHYITFNKDKLADWAQRLADGSSLGDDYSFNETIHYSDCGFLILKRIAENKEANS